MEPFKNVPKQLHFFRADDWCAIYADGELVHWHDTPRIEDFAEALGIKVVCGDYPCEPGVGPPSRLGEMLLFVTERDDKRKRVCMLRKEADRLEREVDRKGKRTAK